MKKTQKEKEMTETTKEEAVATLSLAFRVKPHGENLFSAEMLLISGDKVILQARNGVATTLGHAIGMADDLMDGWAFSEIETKPEEYFKNVML